MPRGNVSKLDYLRPEIIAHFLEGKTGGELVADYPQVPRRTIYRWIKEVKDITGTGLAQPRNDERSTLTECQKQPRANLVSLPMSDTVEDSLPDLQYLKRKLRRIINTDGDNLSKNDSIRVNAINTYLKVILAEYGDSKSALEEEDDQEDDEIDYSKLSDEELTEIYHRKLKTS